MLAYLEKLASGWRSAAQDRSPAPPHRRMLPPLRRGALRDIVVPAVRTQDKTRQDKTRQDKTRQDKTRQDKTRQDKTRQDKIRRRS
jgi:hypothetical protein